MRMPAAEAIVQALVDSYMQFMKANHETVAEELVTILRNERQRLGMRGRNRAGKGCASGHHGDGMPADIGRDPVPQNLDRPLGPIFGQHA